MKDQTKIILSDTILENDLISYLLENPYSFKDVDGIISSTTFSNTTYSKVYEAFKEMFLNKETFNRYDVFREAVSKNPSEDFSKILSLMPTRAIQVAEVSIELKELERKRGLYELSNSITMMLGEDTPSSEISNYIEGDLDSINNNYANNDVSSLDLVYDKVMQELEEKSINRTGFSGIDMGSHKMNMILGGWQEGMSIIAGRPSMGKTIVGLEHTKASAMSGKRVLFLSLEMPKESLVYRFISSQVVDYKYSDIKTNKLREDDVKNIKESKAILLKKLPIFFYDSDNRDINYLSSMIINEVRKNKIDIVFIDYLQLITDNSVRQQDDFTQVTKVSNKIQKLTRKLKIPIVCLSQLSREIEKRGNRTPQLSDLRSSGSIEQDAILVIGLYRDDYYKMLDSRNNGTPPPPNTNELKYIILKNRDGLTGDITRYVDVTTNRIADNEDDLFGWDKVVPQKTDGLDEVSRNILNQTETPF